MPNSDGDDGSGVDLNLDEGMGQFDDEQPEEEATETTSADPEWGEESAPSQDAEPRSSSEDSDQIASSQEGALDVTEIAGSTSIEQIVSHASDGTIEDTHVPGTDYGRIPYVFQRTGQKKTSFDRPGQRRFNTFAQTEDLIEAVEDWVNSEKYPETNVLLADIVEAALIAGLCNPEAIESVLDAWGYKDLEE
ncbi:hypothetical protein HLRTI_000514 [Halorhabdus tiamatea SARL4B]|uniref:Uncharacterized protein n=1 Tax=Halorhabdus tiamatea SARL4B TaxID=1033806 RepID=U2E6G9_9EURY|nr:hypothetical protein [Halorhabdus tiamatea]ERJ07471.1 hypothetical protein HLRTI_000514 [Halorhabdus tiamatea SARL4B]